MDRKSLFRRLARGELRNVAFSDMLHLASAFGFTVVRINGSHHILQREGMREQLNFQEVQGQAKPYQIRQFLRLVERHNLRMAD